MEPRKEEEYLSYHITCDLNSCQATRQ